MTTSDNIITDTAEEASEEALTAVLSALEQRKSFKLEAGAGAGKTYSLIQALRHILDNKAVYLPRSDQRVACLTYTKVARDEIKARTDEDPAIFADTLHGFLWEMISPYQKALAAALHASESWKDLLTETPEIKGLSIDYDFGIRGVHEDRITLHHDDIPQFAIHLFSNKKFRGLITDRFPVVFIDEYQDTPSGLAEAFLSGLGSDRKSPVIAFFGDHWQQIYDKTCGSIDHALLTSISKNANFRSSRSVVNFLNKLRPELPQLPRHNADEGAVTIYHSNSWPGVRQGGHWKGQISQEATQACLSWLQSKSPSSSWIQNSEDLKILMLTHTTIARELGYSSLPRVFRYNDSFTNKEDPVIEYLIDTLEPAMEAFSGHKYGKLFLLLGKNKPLLTAPKDKLRWTKFFGKLLETSKTGTIGDVLDLLNSQTLFSLPTQLTENARDLKEALLNLDASGELQGPRKLVEYKKLCKVAYSEIRALRSYLENETVFSTKHSVKGAEFNDVIVLVGRGWSMYDFAKMVAAHSSRSKRANSFERSRNLFYVSASRAKQNLALLFVQELDNDALAVLKDWVGPENLISIDFDDTGHPITQPH